MQRYTNSYWSKLKKYLYPYIRYITYIVLDNVRVKQSFYIILSTILSFDVMHIFTIQHNRNPSNAVAFVISSYTQPTQDAITYDSQEIVVSGINNTFIKDKLQSFFNIDHYQTLNITQEHVNHWTNQLKLSGFFQQVSSRIFIYKKKKQ